MWGNGLGLLMFVICGLITGVGAAVLRLPDTVVMIVMDGYVRLRQRPARRWWLKPKHGGSLLWLPAWAFGIVLVNVLAGLTGR